MESNNILQFLNSKGYIRRGENLSITSKQLSFAYRSFCAENALPAMKSRTVILYLKTNQAELGITYTNHMLNAAGQEVRGFRGIGLAMPISDFSAWTPAEEE